MAALQAELFHLLEKQVLDMGVVFVCVHAFTSLLNPPMAKKKKK